MNRTQTPQPKRRIARLLAASTAHLAIEHAIAPRHVWVGEMQAALEKQDRVLRKTGPSFLH